MFVLAEFKWLHTSVVGKMSEKVFGFGFTKHIGSNKASQWGPRLGASDLTQRGNLSVGRTLNIDSLINDESSTFLMCACSGVTYFTQSLL